MSATVTVRQCLGVNQDGSPCGAPSAVIMQDGFCFSHSPSVRPEARTASATLGGIKAGAKRRKGIDVGTLSTPEDALRIVARITVAVAAGEIGADQGRTVIAAVAEWRKSYEADVLDRKLAAWEATRNGGR